ncbi:50S ribosomal protein L23 [Candidatus Daviesbacteria bacterium RIFCSPHIGHO2_02_FULL_41_14]|uniref:Large ribosomal subunit protein uL23 n=1 Tax=Candidatus Daviesbacteria bacterium RIFCSPLOWO2_01_FULL_40_24 TaxID=1797787 RepID=A0A1F5MJR9_9BACT|nr:MAG: 50S ribosomal protein L23 [Candidatus Daviesbacteria bacterium RIFCSPHIGHO2_01_FULL_41_45]OGE35381.1 MAG: 50S ribosomal protein L23 [Candidatus Daviesbacteria bacterium RIFCSPHIGHO2_02_FULL_41_14]OGE65624.1 MAG: 50S ribosomal protein L23 [Candidatus Daviesbacteria bacterium RIFCSPLOWO2_01_FULL_40_24]
MKILIEKPYITEKSMQLAGTGLYTFKVLQTATKEEIKKIVHSKFNVDVVSVRTISMKPLSKMQRSRKGYFTRSGFKKALVQLKKGQKIALFEAVSTKDSVDPSELETTVKEKKSLLKGTKVKIERNIKKPTVKKEQE